MGKLNKRQIGKEYEMLAAKYLISKGYKILEMNYFSPHGEIDIIAKDGNTIVFAEIKFRSNTQYGNALEAVDYKKQRHISKAAMHYYVKHGFVDCIPCRFDVIAINRSNEIYHVENAFEFAGYM